MIIQKGRWQLMSYPRLVMTIAKNMTPAEAREHQKWRQEYQCDNYRWRKCGGIRFYLVRMKRGYATYTRDLCGLCALRWLRKNSRMFRRRKRDVFHAKLQEKKRSADRRRQCIEMALG